MLQYSVNNLLIFSYQHAAAGFVCTAGVWSQASAQVSQWLTFKVREEEAPDGSAPSQMAPNCLADPCQPLSEMRAGGPVMSSAFDGEDKRRSRPTFANVSTAPTDVWQTGACTDTRECKWSCYHHHHRHHVQKASVGGGVREPYHSLRHRRLSERTSIN